MVRPFFKAQRNKYCAVGYCAVGKLSQSCSKVGGGQRWCLSLNRCSNNYKDRERTKMNPLACLSRKDSFFAPRGRAS